MLFQKVVRALQWRTLSWYVSYSGWRDDDPDFKITVTLQEDVWYWRFLEWLGFDCGLAMCSWLHVFKLPKFILNIERIWDAEWQEDGEACTFEEWYGDDLASIWHCHIESPILQFVWKGQFKHQKRWTVNMTLAEAKELFKDDPEKLDWIIKDSEKHKVWDAEKAAEEASKKSD